jgi:hypothetical protein
MSSLESWGFLCMVGCTLLVGLSATALTGKWAISVSFIAVVLAILSVCLYAVSGQNRG